MEYDLLFSWVLFASQRWLIFSALLSALHGVTGNTIDGS